MKTQSREAQTLRRKKMKQALISIIILNFIFTNALGQEELKYFLDYDKKFVDSSNAIFYCIYRFGEDSLSEIGSIETYFINGSLLKKEECYLFKQRKNIKTIYYFDKEKIASVTNTLEHKMEGEQLEYFINGQIKRKALYSDGELIKGNCYTSLGKDTTYYLSSGRHPVYPGGINELNRYISENMKYPKIAKKKKISGTVEISVELTMFGELEKIGVTKSVHPLLDNEALRIISNMPKWNLGFEKDNLLPVYKTIPVKFEIKE